MENQNTNLNTDVDLLAVKQKLKSYASGVNDRFFNGILFIRRNIIALIVLFVLGAALGTYLDMNSKVFTHKIFVTPNFKSVDYLYEQGDRIEAKLKSNDEAFISGMGVKEPKAFRKIEVEPVVDIYDFMDESAGQVNNKIDLLKIMSENGEIDKVIEDRATSKNYKHHVITLTTNKSLDRDALIDPLLNLLNASPYLLQVQAESVKNLKLKMQENDSIIKQIDGVVGSYSSESRKANPGLLFYNDNTNITDLLNLKNGLVIEQGKNRITLIDYEKIIKDSVVLANIESSAGLTGKMKLIIPVFFIFVFTVIVLFRKYYRNQVAKRGL